MSNTPDFLAIAKRDHGGAVGLATKLSELTPDRALSPQAISQWKRVPADRVIDVETLTGISRHNLRPDVFGPAPAEGQAA